MLHGLKVWFHLHLQVMLKFESNNSHLIEITLWGFFFLTLYWCDTVLVSVLDIEHIFPPEIFSMYMVIMPHWILFQKEV